MTVYALSHWVAVNYQLLKHLPTRSFTHRLQPFLALKNVFCSFSESRAPVSTEGVSAVA
ncbi:unnamed protein product [Linum tenue]|uniref:Uncharacterized protein n=1 Tax=Linum tenue TaxID=586396 RepID=A0AAV0HDV0_9ROSI|nr:unnamed protein product [Linum tenue]